MTSKIATTHNVNFTQQVDQTANRSLGTVYQNTTGRSMLVIVEADGTPNPGQATGISGITETHNPPVGDISQEYLSVNSTTRFICTVSIIVLPGNYYIVASSGVAGLRRWTEYT